MVSLNPRFLVLLAFCLAASAAGPLPKKPELLPRAPDHHHHHHHRRDDSPIRADSDVDLPGDYDVPDYTTISGRSDLRNTQLGTGLETSTCDGPQCKEAYELALGDTTLKRSDSTDEISEAYHHHHHHHRSQEEPTEAMSDAYRHHHHHHRRSLDEAIEAYHGHYDLQSHPRSQDEMEEADSHGHHHSSHYHHHHNNRRDGYGTGASVSTIAPPNMEADQATNDSDKRGVRNAKDWKRDEAMDVHSEDYSHHHGHSHSHSHSHEHIHSHSH